MRMIVRADAKVVSGVGVADHLARIEQVVGVEAALDRLKGRVHLRAEKLAIPEAAGQPVAVFSAHGAAELDDQVRDFAGDRTQGLHAGGGLDVDDRSDVQAPDIGVAIAGGRHAVFLDDRVEIARRTPAAARDRRPCLRRRRPAWHRRPCPSRARTRPCGLSRNRPWPRRPVGCAPPARQAGLRTSPASSAVRSTSSSL